MAYPLSSEVTPGQPTASAHYNNLRNDALYLGKNELNAAPLGALLAHYEEGLKIELLETDRVRVPASATAKVYLMVNGCMLTANANVDLAAGSKPAGSAAQYYIFAVRSEGSTTFTLDVNTTSTESTDRRRIGGFYWDGSRIDAASFYTEGRENRLANLGMQNRQVFGGRLTLSSGNPVADVETGGTIYYTPYISNQVCIYGHGNGWKEYNFTELSKSLDGMPAGKPVDVFLCDISGTLTLELEGWASAFVRSVALTTQDGIEVKSGYPNRVYLGTVGITGTAAISADTTAKRLIWNRYNRLARPMESGISTNSWTYTTTAYRAVSGTGDVKLEVCSGLAVEGIMIQAGLLMKSVDAYNANIGIGVDTTGANSAQVRVPHIHNSIGPAVAFYAGRMEEGLRTYYLLEYGNSGITYYGSNGAGLTIRGGLTALVTA